MLKDNLLSAKAYAKHMIKEILEKTGISNRRLYSEIAKRKIPRREKRSGSRHSDFYEKTKNHSDYIIEHYKQGENIRLDLPGMIMH